jgi:hypothetical protein
MKNYITMAERISVQSYGRILLNHLSLPENERYLEELAATFDMRQNFGVFLVEMRNPDFLVQEVTVPVGVFCGAYMDVLRATLCLSVVSDLHNRLKGIRPRPDLEEWINIIEVPTSFDFNMSKFHDDAPFMSYPEFVASRVELPSISQFTGDHEDDAVSMTGFRYGEVANYIYITECSDTDLVTVKYDDMIFRDESDEEVVAVAYRCYLNSKGLYDDQELRRHFSFAMAPRRVSITY